MVPGAPGKPLQEISVEGVANIAKVDLVPIGSVVVGLQLNVFAFPESSLPVSRVVAAGKFGIGIDNDCAGRVVIHGLHTLTGRLTVKVTLQGVAIASTFFPIHPEASLAALPVVYIPAIRMKLSAAIEPLTVNAIIESIAAAAAIAYVAKASFDVSAAGRG